VFFIVHDFLLSALVQADPRSRNLFLTRTNPSDAKAGAPVNCWGKFRVPFGEVVSSKRKITTMELMQSQERNEILEDVDLALTYSILDNRLPIGETRSSCLRAFLQALSTEVVGFPEGEFS
jgi:hypothetical protein